MDNKIDKELEDRAKAIAGRLVPEHGEDVYVPSIYPNEIRELCHRAAREGALVERQSQEAKYILDLSACEAENARLRAALEKIAAVTYGLELTDTDDERAEYWSKIALRYQRFAREALGKGE